MGRKPDSRIRPVGLQVFSLGSLTSTGTERA
jgi:hypothetical protein